MWCGSIMFAVLPVFAYYLHNAKMRPGAARSEWRWRAEVDKLGILMLVLGMARRAARAWAALSQITQITAWLCAAWCAAAWAIFKNSAMLEPVTGVSQPPPPVPTSPPPDPGHKDH